MDLPMRCARLITLGFGAAALAMAARPMSARAEAPPGGVASLPTEAALGPFPTLAAYCQAERESGRGRCDAEPNAFVPGLRRGERGAISSAASLRVTRQLGPHTFASCHLALRSAQGWYVSAQTSSCEGPAPGETRSSRLSALSWADGIGFGVLAAVVERVRTVRHEEVRWWGSASYTTEVPESAFQLCGMGVDQVPRCSDFLARYCDDIREPLLGAELGGKLISSADAKLGSRRCSGAVLPQGEYALPFTPGWLPFHDDWVRADGEAAELREGAARLYGPFSSLDAYCADLPRFHDALEPEEEGGAGDGAACERRPGPWNRRRLTARGEIAGVELLRVRDDIAGARFEECRIAVTTRKGVFVSESPGACQGVVGPGRTVTTRLRTLAWLLSDSGSTFKLESEREEGGETAYFVQLCSLGPSGVPSCSPVYPQRCSDDSGGVAELAVSYGDGTLELRPRVARVAGDESSWLAPCSELRLSRPLVFP